jgi:hypothetical protein
MLHEVLLEYSPSVIQRLKVVKLNSNEKCIETGKKFKKGDIVVRYQRRYLDLDFCRAHATSPDSIFWGVVQEYQKYCRRKKLEEIEGK